MSCDICAMINQKEAFKVVYEDNDIIAFLHEAPAKIGHTIIAAKNHHRIVEEIPDELVGKAFNISNIISSAIFDALQVHGTNILANNGPDAGQTQPHFLINIIPRIEGDDINLEWPMSKADPQKLDSTYSFLKDFVEKAISGISGEPERVNMEESVVKSDEDDYMLKQLKRIP